MLSQRPDGRKQIRHFGRGIRLSVPFLFNTRHSKSSLRGLNKNKHDTHINRTANTYMGAA
ncbi:protein of unknown function [Burkholderia multivorans]